MTRLCRECLEIKPQEAFAHWSNLCKPCRSKIETAKLKTPEKRARTAELRRTRYQNDPDWAEKRREESRRRYWLYRGEAVKAALDKVRP